MINTENTMETPAPKKRKTKKSRPSTRALEKAVEEVKDRFVGNPRGDWSKVTPSTLLGLYAYLHETVYKVTPDELALDWKGALSCAKKVLEQTFDNNGEEVVEFIRWVWMKENRKVSKLKEGVEFRISWRYQFSQKLITDYRVYKTSTRI